MYRQRLGEIQQDLERLFRRKIETVLQTGNSLDDYDGIKMILIGFWKNLKTICRQERKCVQNWEQKEQKFITVF